MWKRLAEWYFALEPAGPSGSRWNWDFPSLSALGSYWPLLPVGAGVLVAIYVLELRHRRGTAVWALPILRLLAVAVALLWLGQATLVVSRTGVPSLAILIDESASMSLEDRYDDEAGAHVRELLSAGGYQQPTRANVVKSLLRSENGRLLRELSARYRLDVHAFAESPRLIASAESPADVDALLNAIDAIPTDGARTRPGPSVHDLLTTSPGAPPTAVLIVSDGVASDGEKDRLSSAASGPGVVPLFACGIGSNAPLHDLMLVALDAAPVAFVDDPITFDARLQAPGYAGRRVRVSLRESGGDEPLTETMFQIPDGEAGAMVRLNHTPTTIGTFEFVVQAGPIDGEADLTNNQASIRVQVRSEQLHVLLVERAPRWEFRHLKGVLERDPSVVVQTVLQESDPGYDVDDRTALPIFPVSQAELNAYDVIVLGDVDLAYLHPGALEAVRDFVGERGGGLILIAGDRHNPQAFAGTPLEELLPVMLDDSGAMIETAPRDGFRIEPTRQGEATPMFQLIDRGTENRDIWSELPGLYWMYRARPRRPGALVFAGHATRHTADGRMPIVVMQRYGRGQVVFHATDELWRWRKGVEDLYYGHYWRSLVRYLSRPEAVGAGGIELTTDRRVYGVGDAVRIRARFIDPSRVAGESATVSVVTERIGAAPLTLDLTPTETAGVFEAVHLADVVGDYHSWLAAPIVGEDPPSLTYRVESPQRELQDRQPDHADLGRAAKLTGGAFYTIVDIDRIVGELPHESQTVAISTERVAIWQRWELFALFAAALAAEWLLRKRLRLI